MLQRKSSAKDEKCETALLTSRSTCVNPVIRLLLLGTLQVTGSAYVRCGMLYFKFDETARSVRVQKHRLVGSLFWAWLGLAWLHLAPCASIWFSFLLRLVRSGCRQYRHLKRPQESWMHRESFCQSKGLNNVKKIMK